MALSGTHICVRWLLRAISSVRACLPAGRERSELTTCAWSYATSARAAYTKVSQHYEPLQDAHYDVQRLRAWTGSKPSNLDPTIATRWPIAHCRLHGEVLQNNTHRCGEELQSREPGILDKYITNYAGPLKNLTRREVEFKLNQNYHFRQERWPRLPRKYRTQSSSILHP
jgi:hypothetical protein